MGGGGAGREGGVCLMTLHGTGTVTSTDNWGGGGVRNSKEWVLVPASDHCKHFCIRTH